jgi:hypothetical protein
MLGDGCGSSDGEKEPEEEEKRRRNNENLVILITRITPSCVYQKTPPGWLVFCSSPPPNACSRASRVIKEKFSSDDKNGEDNGEL